MKTFEPIIVDEEINKSLVKAFMKVTMQNFQVRKINFYTFYCQNVNVNSNNIVRYYLYVLLNEFSRSMYVGITTDIKKRLITHSKDEVLGPNDNVTLNSLFIIELEEIPSDTGVFSPNSQVTMIERKLTKRMRYLGYDVRCQFSAMNDDVENGLITDRLVENIEKKSIRQKNKELLETITYILERYQRVIKEGGYYHCWLTYKEEGYYEFNQDEKDLLQLDAPMCEKLLLKQKSQYNETDWEFVKKCMKHESIRYSLWDLGTDMFELEESITSLSANYKQYEKR